MPKPLTYRALYQVLRQPPFNVEEKKGRKTSKRILRRPGLDGRGPFAPVSVPGEGTEINIGKINAILRRLEIDDVDAFWSRC